MAGGLTGWLLDRLRSTRRPRPRLALLERIALAPRQSLALVEAEGRRFLVATSPEGAPAFYALDGEIRTSRAANPGSQTGRRNPMPRLPSRPVERPVPRSVTRQAPDRTARISW
jgi:flagellar biogenesis protein FliO